MSGVSVALDETAREVSERQVLPAGGLRERFDQQRPITVPRASLLLLGRMPSVVLWLLVAFAVIAMAGRPLAAVMTV